LDYFDKDMVDLMDETWVHHSTPDNSQKISFEIKRQSLGSSKKKVEKRKNYAQNAISMVLRVQMKSWAGKALEIVNCCAF
jgi:hypothetical protein